MKTCTTCAATKDSSQFARNGTSGQHAHCKACGRANSKKHYNANRQDYLDRIRPAQRAIQDWIWSIKAAPCQDCGKRFNPWQMDFDHRDGEVKTITIAKMAARRMSRDSILQEISKCDLVCANCHRDRTYKRQVARADASYAVDMPPA